LPSAGLSLRYNLPVMAAALFPNPQDAEVAFYDAFQRGDLDAMMAVWAEDDDVYCVHPGGSRLTGIEQIRESWRQIFAAGTNVRIQLRGVQQMRGGLLAVHSLYEYISVIGERSGTNVIAATNVYLNIGGGWRIVAHHGSPMASPPAQTPPESTPTLLH
jgi:uncharacterized protein (TIGR02246 family)